MTTEINVIHHKTYGKPEDVVEIAPYSLPILMEAQIMVDQKFSPINPADINMMEGKYYTQPDLPSVLGNEGVGVVSHVGPDATDIKVGDRVIMPMKKKDNWIGSWAESYIANESDLIKVPDSISLEQASMMSINPPTAFLMLSQFTHLDEGDWVIQNAGNSCVGRWVIFFAKKLGLKVLSIVRQKSLVPELKSAGSDEVFLESDSVGTEIKNKIGKVKLALNGVGGESAEQLMKALDKDGVMATYGAMSKDSFSVSNGALIYKNIWVTGFNRSKWIEESHSVEVRGVYDDIFAHIKDGAPEIPVQEVFEFEKVLDALKLAQSEKRSGKILLSF
jgi:mitochondrial enoyl-[acyl-carrier protein] reductase / trans-2-enoyl-CoA reductase